MDTNDNKQNVNQDEFSLPKTSNTPQNDQVKNIDEVSGDDLGRMAQNFAERKQEGVSGEVKKQASELEQEILSAFDTEDTPLNEAIESLGDVGPSLPEKEEVLDLNKADSNPQDLVSKLDNKYSKEPESQDTKVQDINTQTKLSESPSEEFPFPSVPSKKEKVQPENLSSQQVDTPSGEAKAYPGSQIPKKETTAVEDLQSDIAKEFGDAPQQTPELQNTTSADLGVGSTYYSDLSDVMSSNEPQTMSELLQKSAFEKKEKTILSPTSRKNMWYILGALLLMMVSVATWFLLFGNKKEVQFITQERVKSLVYSDQDLGINTTGLETFQTKAAIRKVLERKQDSDSLSQIYYVQEDNFGNLRRMGVKDIFDHTKNQTPELLYDNIENEFMHGIYTSDKNYPFIVMKALSYDRTFEGMKNWEPTMIDDLATYFDLPSEATDRSLLQDGFADDLIKNKNVRVARFIPRESDRRGILNILNSDGSEFKDENQINIVGPDEEIGPDSPSPFQDSIDPELFDDQIESETFSSRMFEFLLKPWRTEVVLAQGIGGTFLDDTLGSSGASTTVCYRSNKKCIDILTGQELPGNSTPSTTVACYDELFNPDNLDQLGETFTPEEVAGQEGFVCRGVLSGGDALGFETTLYTELICFDPISGDRLPTGTNQNGETIQQPDALCFSPYQCRRVACFEGAREVPSSFEGRPGVDCRIADDIVSSESDLRKSCVQFNELLTFQNINNMNLCFDELGRYVPVDNRIQTLGDYYAKYARNSQQSVQEVLSSSGGLTCIAPQNRYRRLCLTNDGKIVDGTNIPIGTSNNPGDYDGSNSGGDELELAFCETDAYDGWEEETDLLELEDSIYQTQDEIDRILEADLEDCRREYGAVLTPLKYPPHIAVCFEPYDSESVGEQFNTLNQDIREHAAAIALKLEFLARLAGGFGLFDNDVSDALADAAEIFWQVARGDILQNDIVLRVAETARQLEVLLNRIDPGAPNSELVQQLRWVINLIKEVVGLKYNVAWVTLGNQLPQGFDIYPGDAVEGIEAIQQALVLLGLMDPLSVSGEFDLVTQGAIAALGEVNGVGFTNAGDSFSLDQVFISAEMLELLQQIVQGSGTLFGGDDNATINDFFDEPMGLGAFSEEVEALQVLLYAEGYDVSGFNGIFDEETCLALQQFQTDQGIETADPNTCELSPETIEALNSTIRSGNYLGSGFAVNADGSLEGTGSLLGTFGPGTISFGVSEAEASSLREGDVVLLYTFLDEETVLITRHESVITEVIRRRAFDDIFNTQ